MKASLVSRVSAIAALSCLLFVGAATVRAADVAGEARSHLAAGEFAPALALAQQVQDGAARDALLRDIATAQQVGGAGDAATRTIGNIRDDRARAGAVDAVLAQRLAAPNPILAQAGGGGLGGGGLGGGGLGGGGGNGGQGTANFQPIIDLMKATIEPESWDDAGGTGAVREFPGGVLVDTSGVLRRVMRDDTSGDLAKVQSRSAVRGQSSEVHAASPLRKVSLTRLEKAIQLLRAAGRDPDEAMRMLAGLQRIQYVMVYPETGDLVIAGPAGDWRRMAEGRVVSADNGHPVLQLDDLVVILRHTLKDQQAHFGCSIDPLAENLARTQAFLAESAKHPLKEGREAREQFVASIREKMGRQKIDVFGIDPRTRVGRVLVEADYRMKLVGLGLEPAAGGLRNYLDMLRTQGGNTAGLGLVRWWFALNYDAIRTAHDHTAFEISGQGVKLQSENEMLADQGKRVQTGKADDLNRKFAEAFTREFPALAEKYPIYAELQNIFDLALAASLISSEDLPAKVGWHAACLRDDSQYAVALGDAPKTVQTVAASRVVKDGQIIVQVSGGVKVETQRLVARDKIQTVSQGKLPQVHGKAPATSNAWWWD